MTERKGERKNRKRKEREMLYREEHKNRAFEKRWVETAKIERRGK